MALDARFKIRTLKETERRLVSAGANGDSPLAKMLDDAIREADYDGIFAGALKRSRRVILGYFFHRSKAEVEHLSERDLQRSLQNIRSSKYRLIRKDPGASLKSVPLRRAYGVESSVKPLSGAVRGGGFFSMEFDSEGAVRWYPLIVKCRDVVEMPGEQDYLVGRLKRLVSLVTHLPRGTPMRFARVDVNEVLARVCRESGLEGEGRVELQKRLSPFQVRLPLRQRARGEGGRGAW